MKSNTPTSNRITPTDFFRQYSLQGVNSYYENFNQQTVLQNKQATDKLAEKIVVRTMKTWIQKITLQIPTTTHVDPSLLDNQCIKKKRLVISSDSPILTYCISSCI